MRQKYYLYDSFNRGTISFHCTVRDAVRAQFAHACAFERLLGKGSHTTYEIRALDGEDIHEKVAKIREGFAR